MGEPSGFIGATPVKNSRTRKRGTAQHNIAKRSQPRPDVPAPIHPEAAREKDVNKLGSLGVCKLAVAYLPSQ